MKIGHSEDDTFKSNFYHESVTLKLIEVNYFSHPLDVYEASPEQSPWNSRHYCRSSSEKLQQTTFCQHDFKCNVQEHHFVYSYEVIINCYPNFMT